MFKKLQFISPAGVVEWGGTPIKTAGKTSSTSTILFPPTLSSSDPTTPAVPIPALAGWYHAMPFIIPDNQIGKLNQFRFVYNNQQTATHNTVAVWDGVTGELIESAQEIITTATTAHVDLIVDCLRNALV